MTRDLLVMEEPKEEMDSRANQDHPENVDRKGIQEGLVRSEKKGKWELLEIMALKEKRVKEGLWGPLDFKDFQEEREVLAGWVPKESEVCSLLSLY